MADLGAVGGINYVVGALACGHARRGHQIHVAWVVGPEPLDVFEKQLRSAGVHTHPLRMNARDYWRERSTIRELCRAISPDVAHTHGYRSDVIAGAAILQAGVPVVSTLHGFTGGGLKNRFYEWLHRRTLRRFDAVVAVSEPIAERLAQSGVSADRLHVVQNAWSAAPQTLTRDQARRVLGIGEGAFVFGWAGRDSHEKGIDLFLAALGQLSDLPACASVLGVEPDAGRRLEMLGSSSIPITWHGIVPNAGELFRAFDVFVLSSRTEGTPIVLFEAMAARVPIVATCVGGVPDVLSSRDAWIVPPQDPAALAAALRAAYGDRDNGVVRAKAAWQRLHTQFGPEQWLQRYVDLYSGIAGPLGNVSAVS